MPFKNTVSIVIKNFVNVYKILLFKIIAAVIILSIAAATILPILLPMLSSEEFVVIFDDLKNFIGAFFSGGNTKVYEEIFTQDAASLTSYLKEEATSVILVFTLALIYLLIDNFINGVSKFAFGHVVNEYLAKNAKEPYVYSFIKKLKKACVFQLLYMAVAVTFDLAVLGIVIYVFVMLLGIVPILAPFAVVVLFLVLTAFRHSLTCFFLPSVIAGKRSVVEGIRYTGKITFKHFGRNFSNYLAALLIIYAVNVLFALVTFFASLLITVPLSVFFIITLQFVLFYTAENKKYYIDYDHIVVPKDLREEEKLLNKMDI